MPKIVMNKTYETRNGEQVYYVPKGSRIYYKIARNGLQQKESD